MGDPNPQVSFAQDIKTPIPCERYTLVHMQCAVTDLPSWSKGRARAELISHGNLNKVTEFTINLSQNGGNLYCKKKKRLMKLVCGFSNN